MLISFIDFVLVLSGFFVLFLFVFLNGLKFHNTYVRFLGFSFYLVCIDYDETTTNVQALRHKEPRGHSIELQSRFGVAKLVNTGILII